MTQQKLYLDSCVFIAWIHKKDKFHKVVSDCIKNLDQFDVKLYSSEWALMETIRKLINLGFNKNESISKINNIRSNSKIGKVQISWIEIDEKRYTINGFLKNLHDRLLDVKGLHIADAVHDLILRSNQIENILSTDSDFGVIKTITLVNPIVFAKFSPKKKIATKDG